MALVQFGRNCKGSFEGYRIVTLDRQRNSLKKYMVSVRLLKRPLIVGPARSGMRCRRSSSNQWSLEPVVETYVKPGEMSTLIFSWPRHVLLHRDHGVRLRQCVGYTVTSHGIALPACQDISVLPSGSLLLLLLLLFFNPGQVPGVQKINKLN